MTVVHTYMDAFFNALRVVDPREKQLYLECEIVYCTTLFRGGLTGGLAAMYKTIKLIAVLFMLDEARGFFYTRFF